MSKNEFCRAKKEYSVVFFLRRCSNGRSVMSEEGFKEYATKVASSIKLIVINKSKCPCEDAIPVDIWNGAK